jgi:hypothetical protein
MKVRRKRLYINGIGRQPGEHLGVSVLLALGASWDGANITG